MLTLHHWNPAGIASGSSAISSTVFTLSIGLSRSSYFTMSDAFGTGCVSQKLCVSYKLAIFWSLRSSCLDLFSLLAVISSNNFLISAYVYSLSPYSINSRTFSLSSDVNLTLLRVLANYCTWEVFSVMSLIYFKMEG